MKPCLKCKAELPDSAGHCVYCGSKQAGPQGSSNKSTMMGHPGMVQDMLSAAKAPPGKIFDGHMTPTKLSVPAEERARLEAARAAGLAQTAPQQAFGGAPQLQQPYGAPPAQQPYGAPQQQQPYGAPPAQQPYGAPPAQQPYGAPPAQQPYGAPPAQQPYGAPPAQQPYGAPPAQRPYGAPPAQQSYGAPQQQQPYPTPPVQQPPYSTPPAQQPPYGGPPAQQQPYGGQAAPPFGGANLGIQNAQFGAAAQHQQPYGRGVPDSYRDSLTEQVKPLRAPGHGGRLGEWDESLTTQLLVFGVLLVACFVAPWSVIGGETSFSWSVLGNDAVPFSQKLIPILLALTGVIAVVMGAFKLAPSARALAAAGIGLTPIVVQIASSKPFQWQLPVGALGLLLLVTGLVIRSRHTVSNLGRIVTSIGMVAILAIYLVPDDGAMPIKGLIDGLANLPGKGKVIPLVGVGMGGLVVGLLPLFLAISGLLVWLPGPSRAGTHILSWVHIFWGLLAAVTALVLGPEIVASLKGNLSGIIYLPLAGAAWLTLAAFGIAGVVSNQVES